MRASVAVDASRLKVQPRRHPGRWVVAALLLALAALAGRDVWRSKNIDHHTITHYLFDHQILLGLQHTLTITVIAMVIAVVLGVTIAAMRLSQNPVARGLAWLYTFVFRATPVLLQLIFWFNLALIWKHIKLGIPGTDLTLKTWNTNDVITPLVASFVGLGLAESAYYSEIVRGGLLGVDSGQREAAHALGLSSFQTFRKIVLPQAFRIILPPTGNELIAMLKYSSLASVIGYTDLAGTAAQIYALNLRTIELLVVISFWYFTVTTVLSVGQYFLERRYGRGYQRTTPEPLMARLRGNWTLGRNPA